MFLAASNLKKLELQRPDTCNRENGQEKFDLRFWLPEQRELTTWGWRKMMNDYDNVDDDYDGL